LPKLAWWWRTKKGLLGHRFVCANKENHLKCLKSATDYHTVRGWLGRPTKLWKGFCRITQKPLVT
jgi:hypothetical protein